MSEDVARDSDNRDVTLTIPARPDYLVLARLALSAVCRLTLLSPEEVADLKLAVTEAANGFMEETSPEGDEEPRLNFFFRLLEDRLVLELEGQPVDSPEGEQELGRAIIDAVVDEFHHSPSHVRLVKHLSEST